MVNSLVETGVPQRAGEGWTLTRPLADAGVPATVTGVIAARIDRLRDAGISHVPAPVAALALEIGSLR